MVLTHFFAPAPIQLQFYTCDSLIFGGRGCYFDNKRRKRLDRGIFNVTLGYPGEGPKNMHLSRSAAESTNQNPPATAASEDSANFYNSQSSSQASQTPPKHLP